LTIAGEIIQGDQLNRLYKPTGIYVDDDDQTFYVADTVNNRIMKWKFDANNGEVVAGGNGLGYRIDQFTYPRDVIVDKKNDSLIISDKGNKRVMRYSRRNKTNQQVIISNVNCYGLTMHHNGDLYVSDSERHQVRRWREGEINGTVVAGGNGKGDRLNQLDYPTHIFVDEDHSVYVSDSFNERVMKWKKDANEGIVVAGGHGEGSSLKQLSSPEGLIVDHLGNVYIADRSNHRIMRWLAGANEGSIVVGGNRQGNQPNQFYDPGGLSFDRQGNLFVVDDRNNRVQKFDIIVN
jgi:sugar lactone lactonase YvrE